MPGFDPSPEAEAFRARIETFVREQVVPLEPRAFLSFDDAMRIEVQALGKAEGLWAPHLSKQLGGGAFEFVEAVALFEEAGFSLLGPLALGIAAPDEGNCHLLDRVATEAQRERFLLPLASGAVRSCFAMTEPAPGVGSDPRAVATRAVRVPGGWSLTGDKHFITGADGASFAIVMAATGESPGDGVTMFLVDAATAGWDVTGHYATLDIAMVGGHCSVELRDCFVPEDCVLGEVGEGFRYAQVRLAPARLTHCMRWLGAARRAHLTAVARAAERQLFGARLADLGMAQAMIADNEIDLAASRALLRQAAWAVQQDRDALLASSRCKVFVSEAVGRVVDRSVQLMGGLGTVLDQGVARIYADIRAFRIYDGASEVHRMSIAKRAVQRVSASS
ncbi:MAG: acyl-CoA dehydrogenase [Frankiales bacterium]|nr:acyl-CoA dehydrogenase [Frankiales bacterium]